MQESTSEIRIWEFVTSQEWEFRGKYFRERYLGGKESRGLSHQRKLPRRNAISDFWESRGKESRGKESRGLLHQRNVFQRKLL